MRYTELIISCLLGFLGFVFFCSSWVYIFIDYNNWLDFQWSYRYHSLLLDITWYKKKTWIIYAYLNASEKKHYFPTKWNSNAFSNHENLEWTMHRWKHLLVITSSIIFWHMQLDINKNDTHLIFSWKYMTIWSHKQFKSTAP